MTRPRVVCHVFTAGWREPLEDLAAALTTAGLTDHPLQVGLVGPAVGRRAVVEFLSETVPVIDVLVSADEGDESVTLNALRAQAIWDPHGSVLYCHSKGASRATEINRRWRRAMITKLILPWRELAVQLGEVDVIGPLWQAGPHGENDEWFASPFFAGNFWMARTEYVAGLPTCPDGSFRRRNPEEWIGWNAPRVLDVLPGFPDYEFFGLEPPSPENVRAGR